ncbi:MAG: Efflux ABC transporter, permease/ATP-binding protein, partial [uncultured Solirubrobacteraceae bacterium]
EPPHRQPLLALQGPPDQRPGAHRALRRTRDRLAVPAPGGAGHRHPPERHGPARVARGRDGGHRGGHGGPRRGADLAVQPGRPAGHARPARRCLPPPAAAVARLLHAHAHGRGPEPDLQRHRRRAERRDLHGDVHRLQRHDGARRHRGDVRARLAPGAVLPRAAAVLHLADQAGRRGAQADHLRAPGPPGGHERARGGVPVGLGDPARQDDGPVRGAGRALHARVRRPGRPRGALPDGGPLADGFRADRVRRDARARLPVRRSHRRVGHGGGLPRHARGLHDAPDAAVLSRPVPAQRRHRHPDVARAVPADLRVPGPRRGHRGGPAPRDARPRAGARRGRLRGRLIRLRRGRGADDRRRDARRPGRHDAGHRGGDGLGQDDAGLPRRAAVRPGGRPGDHRRGGRPRALLRVPGRHGRARLPGDLPLPRDDPRQPALRQARGHGRGARGRRARRAGPRPHRLAARGLRHGGRRARLPLLGRREAAHRHRPHDPAQPARARARRGDERPGQRDRARGAGRPGPPVGGPDHDRHRPPPLHGARRRPARGPRPRAGRRARHPRRARGPRGPVRAAGRRGRDDGRGRGV